MLHGHTGDEVLPPLHVEEICIGLTGESCRRRQRAVQHLPAHWRTLYELTLLTYKQFAEGIKSGRLFLVTAFRCRRLGLHFGRGDRHPATS